MIKCPCGSGKKYNDCCKPVIKGTVQAESPEVLMRARYSAYVKMEIPFVIESTHSDSRKDLSEEETRKWADESDWDGLEIVEAGPVDENSTKGTVEFKAFFKEDRIRFTHHELSQFKKTDGKWFFYSGKMVNKPVERETSKVGRNDICPCGSGKKFKKCCGS